MGQLLSDDDVVALGELAQKYMRHLARLSPKEKAKALGMRDGAPQSDIYIAEWAAIETLQRQYMLAHALVEGKRAVRDVMTGYVIGFSSASASALGAQRLGFYLSVFGELRPDKVVKGFFVSKEGYAISCGPKGSCTAITPDRVVVVKP